MFLVDSKRTLGGRELTGEVASLLGKKLNHNHCNRKKNLIQVPEEFKVQIVGQWKHLGFWNQIKLNQKSLM